jgi:hypothetical protein
MSTALQGHRLTARASTALAAALDVPDVALRSLKPKAASEIDLLVKAAGRLFAVEVLGNASVGAIAAHAPRAVRAAWKLGRTVIPVVAVPFMTSAGARACEAAGASWLDLSGNAHIVASGLRIILSGHANQFRARGRPASVFAPKSARVARWLLLNPGRSYTQREIARGTGMTDGFVSKIVARLQADGFIDRVDVSGEGDGAGGGYGSGSGDGAGRGDGTGGYGASEADGSGHGDGRRGRAPVRVRDPALLLDAWRDEYEFSKHTILRGHIVARSGDALTRFVGDRLAARKVEHAATGLSAAWQLSQFAMFRIATFYLATDPTPTLLKDLGFREEPRGANAWLVVPNDAGVFLGADEHEGVRCVHPVQAYLDLKEHPERAAEAAERLRSDYMKWNRD